MSQAVALDWWPVTRDCFAYGVTVVLLIVTFQDGRVEWYESLLLVSVYLLYLLSECARRLTERCSFFSASWTSTTAVFEVQGLSLR